MLDKVEEFYRPGSVREALRLLHTGNGKARVVAGGTGVIVGADRSTRFLIDITQAGLGYIRRKGNACHIGATTTMADLEASPVIRGLAGGIVTQASAACRSVQVRNRATLGGNLVTGSPATDIATPLLALNAELVMADRRGRRKIPLAAIYSTLRETLLDRALIVEIVVPSPPRARHWCYHKLARTEVDISLVNLAAGLQLDNRGRVKWARLSIGALAPTPLRAVLTEKLMIGRLLDETLLEEVCDQVAREVTPASDVRASAEYRRTMCRVLARRAIEECAGGSGCVL
jgi:CO/xanthine dehydrogenase FAD-binding subunit